MSGILQLINTFGPSGPFAVKNSLRLRSTASAYLSRTITLSATWTLSVWVKRGSLGVTSPIFGASVLFNSNDTLTAGTLTTTAVYRDPSAWYHIVVSNSGCYVNGVSVGSTATGILVSPLIGSNAINYFDGYLAELNLVDGQALTPSSFGAFDATSGVWQPTRYSGTYGTNGFYLKFSDTTSTTTLCYDYSGNSNNWTPNNISLTAGSTYDSMLDSPTNYDNGGNGVGNYAVLNPLDLTGFALTNGNLSVSQSGGSGVAGSIGVSSGKFYWEYQYLTGTERFFGIISTIHKLTDLNTITATVSYMYGSEQGGQNNIWYGGSGSYVAIQTGLAAINANDIIGIALDCDGLTLQFYKNGSAIGTSISITSGVTWQAWISSGNNPYNNFTGNVNFGQRPFAYTPPTGYKALNTQNLPAPSIQNGSNFMAATLYTGNGTSQSLTNTVNGTSFQPDFVWLKSRSNAYSHKLYDSIRGVYKELSSDSTAAESTDTNQLTAFNSNGWSVGSGLGSNGNGSTFVGWQWKAGGTAVTNTAGSITSSVSANTTAGFSVVTYTGTGATATIGHGLGKTPDFAIFKCRNQAGPVWATYHSALGPNYVLQLQATAAASSFSGYFGTPSSTTIGILTGTDISINGNTYVAYCFAAIAGYSAFGSYTGNGSTDGPFVYCGMRPRWILIKSSSNATDWVVFDTSRDSYNMEINYLVPNTSGAETSGASVQLDGLSNGFKVRGTWSGMNASGGTYIYAAFAENPLKYSLAR